MMSLSAGRSFDIRLCGMDSVRGPSGTYRTFDRVVKVLALGASLFGGVGSIPTECNLCTLGLTIPDIDNWR